MYKILVIGDQATGKTSMVNRFVNKTFDPVHRATIACDFSLKIVQINGRPLRIQLWDIAGNTSFLAKGQDRLQGITKLFCRGAAGGLVVSDVTRRDTLENSRQWKIKVDQQLMDEEHKTIPMVLACNKYDLIEDENDLDDFMKEDYLRQFAAQNSFSNLFYTSAKKDYNVSAAIFALVHEVVKREHEGTALKPQKPRGSFALTNMKSKQQRKKEESKCCK